MSVDEENELLKQIAEGSQKAFSVFYELHKRRIFGLCFRLMGDLKMAEDMTQEVWIKVAKNAGTYRPIASISAWLCQITRNTCLSHLRKKNIVEFDGGDSEEQLLDIENTPESFVSQATELETIESMFATLPINQRFVVTMFLYEELSHAEIADRLNTSVGGVKQLLHRAKKSLRANYGERSGGLT